MANLVQIIDIPGLGQEIEKIKTITKYFEVGPIVSNAIVGYKTIEGGYIRPALDFSYNLNINQDGKIGRNLDIYNNVNVMNQGYMNKLVVYNLRNYQFQLMFDGSFSMYVYIDKQYRVFPGYLYNGNVDYLDPTLLTSITDLTMFNSLKYIQNTEYAITTLSQSIAGNKLQKAIIQESITGTLVNYLGLLVLFNNNPLKIYGINPKNTSTVYYYDQSFNALVSGVINTVTNIVEPTLATYTNIRYEQIEKSIYNDVLFNTSNTSFSFYSNGNNILNGALYVHNNTSLESNLNVKGKSTLQSTLNVSDNASFQNGINVSNNASFYNKVNIREATTLQSTLNVSDNVSIFNGLNVSNNVSIVGQLYVSDNVSIFNGLNVSNNTSIVGTLYVKDNVSIFNGLNISNNTSIIGTLYVKDNVSIFNGINISNNTSIVGQMYVSDNVSIFNGLNISNNTSMIGTLYVKDNVSIFNGLNVSNNVSIVGQMRVSDNVSIFNGLNISNNTSMIGTLYVKDNVSILNGLNVLNNVSIVGQMRVSDNVSMFNGLNISNNTSIVGNLHVTQSTILKSTLNVSDNVSFLNMLIVSNNTSLLAKLEVSDNAKFMNGINVTGDTILKNDLNVTGHTTLNTLTTGGSAFNSLATFNEGINALKGISVTNGIMSDTLETTGNSTINGKLFASILVYGQIRNVSGYNTFNGPTIILEDFDGTDENGDNSKQKGYATFGGTGTTTINNNLVINPSSTSTIEIIGKGSINGIKYEGPINISNSGGIQYNNFSYVGPFNVSTLGSNNTMNYGGDLTLTGNLHIKNEGTGPALVLNQVDSNANDIAWFQDNTNNVVTIADSGNTTIKGCLKVGYTPVTTFNSNGATLDISGICAISGDLRLVGNVISQSDRRIKTNINPIYNCLEKIDTISGYTYNRLDLDNEKHIGLIAQEVEELFPELVTETNNIKGINYQGFIAVLLNCIKELNKKIENIEIGNR
jgi:UDP-3-O-[3-hydroxymyristoyl] glucosamine N-acyltransferase